MVRKMLIRQTMNLTEDAYKHRQCYCVSRDPRCVFCFEFSNYIVSLFPKIIHVIINENKSDKSSWKTPSKLRLNSGTMYKCVVPHTQAIACSKDKCFTSGKKCSVVHILHTFYSYCFTFPWQSMETYSQRTNI